MNDNRSLKVQANNEYPGSNKIKQADTIIIMIRDGQVICFTQNDLLVEGAYGDGI